HGKLEHIPELGGQDKERQKGDGAGGAGAAPALEGAKGKGSAEPQPGKTPERKETEGSNVQSSPSPTQGDLPRDAKPEEPKAGEALSGNDITAPPSKELPPSPEKKPKVGAAPLKAKPSASSSPRRPSSATPGTNKKPSSPTAGPATPGTTAKRPGTTLTPKETKPKVTDAKPSEKRTSLAKAPSCSTPKTPS
ncbi:MAP4 protein, partial [Sitta europaea]|nr:MAP4 protein [Sitta europaea]